MTHTPIDRRITSATLSFTKISGQTQNNFMGMGHEGHLPQGWIDNKN